MTNRRKPGSLVRAALIGSVACFALVGSPMTADVALAKSEKADRGGNGGGGDRGTGRSNASDRGQERSQSRGSGNRGSETRGKSADAPGHSRSGQSAAAGRATSEEVLPKKRKGKPAGAAAVAEDGEEEVVYKNHGQLRAAMGALNAANASATARANASPNSRVGRIELYRQEVLNGESIFENLETARAELDAAEEPERSLRQVRRDLRETRGEISGLRDRIEALEADLEAAGGSDADIEAELAEARNALREARRERRDLTDELETVRDYDDAVERVEDLGEDLAASQEEALRLLDDAANKEVTDPVIDEVNRLLELDFDYDDALSTLEEDASGETEEMEKVELAD